MMTEELELISLSTSESAKQFVHNPIHRMQHHLLLAEQIERLKNLTVEWQQLWFQLQVA